MRLIALVVIFIFTSHSGFCKPPRPVSSAEDADRVIRYLLTSDLMVSVLVKPVYRMGDAAAVAVTRVLGDQELSTEQIGKVLSILHMAFERPAVVQTLSDREPKTTLFVLHSLQGATQDDPLKAQIQEERKFILSQFANASKQ